MRASLALPDTATRQPAVVVIHEIFGLNDDIRRITRQFAEAGYVALAPDLYDGPGPRILCVLRTLRALSHGSGAAFEDLDAVRRWLGERPEVDASRIGVVGFCMGGGFALLFAVRAPVGVAATFYGDVPKTADALRGVCPVLAGYGERDRMFLAAGKRLEQLLEELEVERDVALYPGVGHSYMSRHSGALGWLGSISPMAAGYDEAAAEDSWRRMLDFFERHLSSAVSG